jgi:hypothetical protein
MRQSLFQLRIQCSVLSRRYFKGSFIYNIGYTWTKMKEALECQINKDGLFWNVSATLVIYVL